MTSQDEQPTSRRAARMVERERAASGPVERERAASESQVESTVERVQGAGPVVSNAIFDGASWAQPEEIRSWAPGAPASNSEQIPEPVAAPVQSGEPEPEPTPEPTPDPTPEPVAIVRRRDLRSRPADAPPVGLTGEIVVDRSQLVPPVEVPVAPTPAPEPVAAEPVVVSPPANSIFAAPPAGAPPLWSGAAAPTSAAVEAVDDAPSEQTFSRRARRAMAEPDATSFEAPSGDLSAAQTPAAEAVAADPIETTATSTMPPRSNLADTGSGWLAPDGHWTRQLADSSVDEPFESTFSRQVGSTAPATNALVIPTAQPLDLSGPLTATGEIMLTGSIKLPDAYARTGATDLVDLNDRDDLDDLFDDGAPLDFPADSQPIRAAAAVSGEHVLGSPIVSTIKPGRGNRVLTGLLITASALAVVVTGLIIAAFAFGVV